MLFSTSDYKESEVARTFRHNSKRFINREAEVWMETTMVKTLYFATYSFARFFPNLKNKCSHVQLNAGDIAGSFSTLYLIFQFVKIFHKLLITNC